MSKADIQAVMEIEETTITPWSIDLLAAELEQKHGWRYVYRNPASNKVIGFIIGTQVHDEAEVRKIAVSQAYHRSGVASALLDKSFKYLQEKQVAYCFLELRESNMAALMLYQKKGFQVVGKRKNYYSYPTEDALLLKKNLGDLIEKH